MTGPGSVDDVAAQVFRAPGGRFRASYLKDLPVTVSWLPGSQATNGSGVFAENLNCSLGAGASYAPPDLPAPVTLTECFSHCRVDPQCDAVRVNWFTIPSNWTSVKIGCGLRGGIELASCTVQAPVYSRVGTVQYSTFAVDAPSKSQLVVAVTALAGYLPVVRNSGNDWTTSVAPWPGEQGGSLPRLLVAMRDESSLSLKALRMRVPAPSSEAHYGMLRYDALGTGRAAIIAINLGATRSDVQLDLTGEYRDQETHAISQLCFDPMGACLRIAKASWAAADQFNLQCKQQQLPARTKACGQHIDRSRGAWFRRIDWAAASTVGSAGLFELLSGVLSSSDWRSDATRRLSGCVSA